MSIGISEEVSAPGPHPQPLSQRARGEIEGAADVELLVEALRVLAAAQARAEVEALREELSEARGMIADLERMLEGQPPLQLPPNGGEGRERPYSPRARQILEGGPLFIDYETTGLSKDDAVVEVCVVDGQGRVLLSTLVNPERHIPAEATEIHGVRDADVMDAPTWEEIGPDVELLIAGRTVVAHNASFEAKYTPETWGVKWTCSKKLADQALGKAPYVEIMHDRRRGGSLEARLWQCGLAPGPEHTAAGDCISTLRLVMYLAGDDRPVDLIY